MLNKIFYFLVALNLLLIPIVFAQEVGIPLGEETVVIQKSLNIIGFRYEGCNTPGEQKLYIEYYLNGSYRQKVMGGYELYDFYINKWVDGRAIINAIAEHEGLDLDEISLVTAENQFVAGLPVEEQLIESMLNPTRSLKMAGFNNKEIQEAEKIFLAGLPTEPVVETP